MSDQDEVHIDPEVTKRLAEQEIKRKMDPDYNLAISAKRKVAAEMEREAQAIQDQLEGREIGTPPEDAAAKAAVLASEGVSAEEATRLATEKGSIVVVKPGGKSEGGKQKYTLLPDGTIMRDPDGEYETLNDALLARANLTQRSTPMYYYQDPADGQFKEAKGPVVIQQPTPPITYMVTSQGEVKEMKPGMPVVIQQPPATGTPLGKSWVVKPDGSVEEQETGKPIVIKLEATSPSPQSGINIQPVDEQGQPLGGVMQLTIPQIVEYNRGVQQIKHDDEKHTAFMDIATVLKDEIPRIVGAADRQSKKGGGGQQVKAAPGSSKQVEQELQEQNFIQCPHCQTKFTAPKGMTDVLCPNPHCPSNLTPKEG